MTSLARCLDPELIQQVQRLDLRARFIVEGFLAGLHRSPFQGPSVEFSEHRKYVQGDDLRSIDWNVFARTDRMYVRRYAAETHLDCHLLLDASASMGYVGPRDERPRDGAPAAKLLYAVHLAAALAYLVMRQQDAVGLGIIGGGLRTWLPPRSRRTDLVHLLAALAAVRPSGETGLVRGVHDALHRAAHRGVFVILSDLLTDGSDLLRAFHHVRYRGHDLIVMHVLDAAETSLPFHGVLRLEDPESGAWLEVDSDSARAGLESAVRAWRAELKGRLDALRADYVALDTSMPFNRALVEFLIQRSRRR
ncbi:MAG: DUF58 domain-containing protein [Phycisphaerae bacterium]|jgi:uncharacterized protein (DUF58 family)